MSVLELLTVPDPSVSRLRSQTHARNASSSTHATTAPLLHTRTPSHFSQVSISRSDSFSTASHAGPSQFGGLEPHSVSNPLEDIGERSPAFSFHPLRQLSASLFNRGKEGRNGIAQPAPQQPPPARKATFLGLPTSSSSAPPLPDPNDTIFGKPTVMDVNGMIAVGCESGHTVVYSFSQEIRCVLGTALTRKFSCEAS